MEERQVTRFEEQVYRLCHHDFDGLSQAVAAERLGVSQKDISVTLSTLKKKCPQLFPILTRQQAFIHNCIIHEGLSHKRIADILGVSKSTIDSTVNTLRAKGMNFARRAKTTSYENWMDKYVKHKF